jgi:hypothetical protein
MRYPHDDIKTSIKAMKIAIDKGDNETAHVEEDDMYITLLRMIATGKGQKKDFVRWAKLALEADDMEYTRWYS